MTNRTEAKSSYITTNSTANRLTKWMATRVIDSILLVNGVSVACMSMK